MILCLEIKSWQLFFLARLTDYEGTWIYTNVDVLSALGYMNKADLKI